jgi:hypothetical protein
MLHAKNTIVISTTLPKNNISEKRRNHLVNQFSKFNLPLLLNHGIINTTLPSHAIMFQILKNALEIFQKTTFDYAILCDDDFYPINEFLEEVNKTIDVLPPTWRCLHLCPGYLWGRAFRNYTKIGRLNPEHTMQDIPFHESGRYYLRCDSKQYVEKQFWLGGPIAFVLPRQYADIYLQEFIHLYNANPANNDVILTHMLNENDFVCREPMLGFENEQGGTTFK